MAALPYEAAVQREMLASARRRAQLEMALEFARDKLTRYVLPALADDDWRKAEAQSVVDRINQTLAVEARQDEQRPTVST